jgi:hypothetical protein
MGVQFVPNSKTPRIKKPIPRWILWGIVPLFLVGSPLHFLFDWTGKIPFVGIFVPVSESVWEHLKLAFWPVLIWWVVGYFIFRKKNSIPAAKWFTSTVVALLTSTLVIVLIFYTYSGAFGIESLAIDIISLLAAIAAGQFLALHFYRRATFINCNCWLYLSIAIIALFIAVFICFTFFAPHIPIFRESVSGTYGIRY